MDGCVQHDPCERLIVEDGPVRPEVATVSPSDAGLKRALVAARTAAENRGQDIVVLDMRAITPVFDYFVLASGTSRRQLHAMSEEIDDALEKGLGDRRLGIEGYEESRWILLDYGDVVIHLFEPETRAYYALEQLWAHAQRVPLPPLPSTP
jgi:ribosome-associated protein